MLFARAPEDACPSDSPDRSLTIIEEDVGCLGDFDGKFDCADVQKETEGNKEQDDDEERQSTSHETMLLG